LEIGFKHQGDATDGIEENRTLFLRHENGEISSMMGCGASGLGIGLQGSSQSAAHGARFD
jgi:hypothetical protein